MDEREREKQRKIEKLKLKEEDLKRAQEVKEHAIVEKTVKYQ